MAPEHAQQAMEALLEGTVDAVKDGPYTIDEAIILKQGRPALLVQDDAWAEPELTTIKERLQTAPQRLHANVPRVGRLEITNAAGDYVGTGWMIDSDTLITNRHVAQFFSDRVRGGYEFRRNGDGAQLHVQVDFAREYQRPRKILVSARKILFIERQSRILPDMALIQLDASEPLPAPIELADGIPQFRDNIAVIGYPAEDRRNDAFAMRQIFQDIYGVKRFSPGKIRGVREDGNVLMHDCTTLGGNSGSVVLSLDDGKAVGLHFSGSYLENNYAVTAAAVKQRLSMLGHAQVLVPETLVPPLAVSSAAQNTERSSFDDRGGYNPDFLGQDMKVPLPEVAKNKEKLLAPVEGRTDGELRYTHFSIKMRADRRLAFFTAVNIDGEKMFNVRRRRDRWHQDPRLQTVDHQTDRGLYLDNPLDRGHLVRRLDPAWGDSREEAIQAAADTFVFANCSPQHARLNQHTWLNLEDYILDNANSRDLKVSVFTGHVFGKNDKEYRGVLIPEEYW
ncbi:MAG: DNA/RNA non-specific endonuclease, partial [Myxococcota bacterium]